MKHVMKTALKWGLRIAAGLVLLVAALVGYAAMTAESRLRHPDAPFPKITASSDPAVIERGRYLAHGPAHCSQCHSTDDRSKPELVKSAPLKGGLAFEMGPLGTTWARNLTPDVRTGIGPRTDAELARAIRSGVMHDGELSFFMRIAGARLADEDLTAVISYLRTVPPVENEVEKGSWFLVGKILLTYAFPPLEPRPVEGPAYVPASEEPSVERGRYLAEEVMLCVDCHTKLDMGTFTYVGPKAAGSLPDPSHGEDKDKEFVAPNLTSHATGVTGRYDEDQFVARIKAGRVFGSSIMPWESFQATTEADLRSVYRYLRTLPPVDNDVGPTYRDKGWKPPASS